MCDMGKNLLSSVFGKREAAPRRGEDPLVTAVVVSAGRSERMRASVSKQFLPVCDVPVIARTLSAFEACRTVGEVVVVARLDDMVEIAQLVKEYGFAKVVRIVPGGRTRQQSAMAGVRAMNESTAFVAVHDGARPLVTPACIDRIVRAAAEKRAVSAAVRCKDTVKIADEKGAVLSTPDRGRLWNIQTPQVFEKSLYQRALETALEEKADYTDDCQLVEHAGGKVYLEDGEYTNIKITTPEDIAVAEAILRLRGDAF